VSKFHKYDWFFFSRKDREFWSFYFPL
jgi:hypothetical protein